MKGQKLCKHCGTATGPRAYFCPNEKCGKPFVIAHQTQENAAKAKMTKKKARINRKVDWTTLKPGDKIKVIAGSGPYFTKSNRETVPTGYSGYFQVDRLAKDGIHAYATTMEKQKKDGEQYTGHCFIFMGPTRQTNFGSTLVAHKIRLRNTKDKPDDAEV